MVKLSFKEISDRLIKTDLPEADLVIGIGSGGIVPASLVAFRLKCDLEIMILNYRDENNAPKTDEPVVVTKPKMENLKGKRILLVDDVSVSGKTMALAAKQLEDYKVKTLALKGKADIVLFPEIEDCVKWPWKE